MEQSFNHGLDGVYLNLGQLKVLFVSLYLFVGDGHVGSIDVQPVEVQVISHCFHFVILRTYPQAHGNGGGDFQLLEPALQFPHGGQALNEILAGELDGSRSAGGYPHDHKQ